MSEVSESRNLHGVSVKVKLHDKLKALDALARHLGMFNDSPSRGEQPVQITRVTVVLPAGHGPPVIEGTSADLYPF